MARHLKGRKQILSLSLDAELIRRVEDIANAKGMSRSAMVEELIAGGIDQEEKVAAAFANPIVTKAFMGAFMNKDVLEALIKAMGEKTSPADLEKFHLGIQLLNNYSDEFQKGVAPEVAAATTVRKTVAQKRAERGKGKKGVGRL